MYNRTCTEKKSSQQQKPLQIKLWKKSKKFVKKVLTKKSWFGILVMHFGKKSENDLWKLSKKVNFE